MTSHDLPVSEIQKLLSADKAQSEKHNCTFSFMLITPSGRTYEYCRCGAWKPEKA